MSQSSKKTWTRLLVIAAVVAGLWLLFKSMFAPKASTVAPPGTGTGALAAGGTAGLMAGLLSFGNSMASVFKGTSTAQSAYSSNSSFLNDLAGPDGSFGGALDSFNGASGSIDPTTSSPDVSEFDSIA